MVFQILVLPFFPFVDIDIDMYVYVGENAITNISSSSGLLLTLKLTKKLGSMISYQTTFYSEQNYSSRCFREQSISLINYHYHFSFRKWSHHFREGSGCKYDSSSTRLASYRFLQFRLSLFTHRIQSHPLCNYMFFKRNWWECEYCETVSCFVR